MTTNNNYLSIEDGEFIGSIDEKHFRRPVIREAKDSHANPSTKVRL